MTHLKLTLFAAAATLAASVGGASALPFNSSLPALAESNVQHVRIVCNQFGQCYDTRNRHNTRYVSPYHRGYAYQRYDRRQRKPDVSVGPFGLWLR